MTGKKRHRRWALAEAQNWRCAYCLGVMAEDGEVDEGATVEHVRAVHHGGPTRRSNLVAACRACNTTRGGFQSAVAFSHLRLAWKKAGIWPACSPLKRRHQRRVLLQLGAMTR